jgi:glycolate oxidase iron-sulfur subunit
MQTNFSPEQLADPRTAEADKILQRCVHCGLCTATCPTYVLLGDERDSPRGRIYLMKDMFEGDHNASKEVTLHVDRCLSCLSCMTTCPGGVDYMHLVDLARAHIEDTYKRPVKNRVMRRLLMTVLPDPGRFRLALWGATLARPFRSLFRVIGLGEVASMLELAPVTGPAGGGLTKPGVYPAEGERTKRVALLTGCAQQALRSSINEATIRLLNRQGVEVVVPPDQVCCGALVHHMGREADALTAARHNVDAWWTVDRETPLDAVIINASGCGTVVKDYAHMLKRDAGYRERAEELAAKTKDITEFLEEIELAAPVIWSDLRIAYHSACSMQHGQRITAQPRALLRKAGFSVVEVPEGHICCGSAGTYNILQSQIASRLRERKIGNIESVKPDAVAAGNMGCIAQLQSAASVPVVHTVELLDWATGGPCPKEMLALRSRTRAVEDLIREEA